MCSLKVTKSFKSKQYIFVHQVSDAPQQCIIAEYTAFGCQIIDCLISCVGCLCQPFFGGKSKVPWKWPSSRYFCERKWGKIQKKKPTKKSIIKTVWVSLWAQSFATPNHEAPINLGPKPTHICSHNIITSKHTRTINTCLNV